ncbi:polypyrimidine tract-binding protein homolog 1 isoform X2 [Magnolia sinica]|uniref:polypyrimidine tract-binding protein homolog 1 isoform X2 n=2 Tax=Magnolia sinica TaxID=86752 RepID=UPI002658F24C|nr:polypyrimidine tract-binding protein homolog 1 isoform X2 [Magnolia sinica]
MLFTCRSMLTQRNPHCQPTALGDISLVGCSNLYGSCIFEVFSAFGFVHKIATFEKAAGFQALIQFSDSVTASAARDALDGRSIPRYLLPEHVSTCHLRISFSAHTDLNIKFQSHRSRDYTNPYLPVNPSAIEGTVQPTLGPDGKKKEPESNVLLASIENMQYAVTVDVLHTVFSAFGTVQKIAIFEKNGGMQALIQYPDITTAAVAKEALEGHCIYDGGYCKLHLSYSRHTDLNVKAHTDRSRDYTIPDSGLLAMTQAPGLPTTATSWQSPQAVTSAPMFGGTGAPAQLHNGQMPAWDSSMQAGRPSFVSVPSSFPGQTYGPSSAPYSTPGVLPGPSAESLAGYAKSSGFQQHEQPSGMGAQRMPQYGLEPNARPGGTPPSGQPPLHYA